MQSGACLICGEDLIYLDHEEEMQCSICNKKVLNRVKCKNGHYICDACHQRKGVVGVQVYCLQSKSKNPLKLIQELMLLDGIHMHGPEHHVMVGCALLTAYHNAGGKIDLVNALNEMLKRGGNYPGGSCGFWGACGAAVSVGMAMSILLSATPLTEESWGLCNQATAHSLKAIGDLGGPRCCKRNSFTALIKACEFIEEHVGIKLETEKVVCTHSLENRQCKKEACPYYKPRKKVAFICVHNSCRSQIAEALGRHFASDVFDSYSAGTETKPKINQDAVRLMKERYGIDMEEKQYSKLFSDIPTPDLAISMGCNVACPMIGKPFDDNWMLEDPTGKTDKEFHLIIDEIEKKILQLKDKLKND